MAKVNLMLHNGLKRSDRFKYCLIRAERAGRKAPSDIRYEVQTSKGGVRYYAKLSDRIKSVAGVRIYDYNTQVELTGLV